MLTCLVVSAAHRRALQLHGAAALPGHRPAAHRALAFRSACPGGSRGRPSPWAPTSTRPSTSSCGDASLLERVIDKLDGGPANELMAGPLRSPLELVREKLGRKAPTVDATGVPLSPPVEAFRSRLTIEPLPGSRLVNLRFAAYDPGARGAGRERPGPGLHRAAAGVPLHHLEGGQRTGCPCRWSSSRRSSRAPRRRCRATVRRKGCVTVDETQALLDQKLQSLTGALMNARTDRIAKEAVLSRLARPAQRRARVVSAHRPEPARAVAAGPAGRPARGRGEAPGLAGREASRPREAAHPHRQPRGADRVAR